MNIKKRQALDRMFHPRGIAVFGAVHEAGKFGHMVIQSLVHYGYKGRIYPIHAGSEKVMGLKVFKNLMEVEGPVDLACVCVPADKVPGVLQDCLRHGVAGAQIISSGFAETGEAHGKDLQEEVSRISLKGLRVLGPNCFGAHCPAGGITILPGFDFSKNPGPVSLISQSGGVAADFGHEARMSGLGISKILSFGNGCDLDAIALLDYLSEDPDTGYVGAYLEGIGDGRKFVQIIKNMTPKKPVLVWKGGLTPLGKGAVQSHTGSLSGESHIWKGLMAQTGAVAVEGVEELVDTMMSVVHLRRRGRQVALLGGGGAIGVFSSDLAHRLGLDLPTFGSETQSKLRRWFPAPGNSMANPVDTGTPFIPLEAITSIIEEILVREPLDVLVVILLLHPLGVLLPTFLKMDGLQPPGLDEYMGGLLEVIEQLKGLTGKDVVMVLENRANLPENDRLEGAARSIRLRYHSKGIPVYPTVARALRAIRNASGVKPQ
jgi:acyl-CoA synthetase (NDP forming)